MQFTKNKKTIIHNTKKITILGKELDVKGYVCSHDGVNYPDKKKNAKLGLYILPDSYCNAYCKFCVATNIDKKQKIDLKKLEIILKKLKKEDIVKQVSFTGGEPMYDVDFLNEAVSMVFEIMGLDMEVSISTNGVNLDKIHKIKYLDYIDAIHVSRHHYSDNVNNSIFETKMPSAKELKSVVNSVPYKDLFVFNCMLLENYINSLEKVHKFLDFSIDVGVGKVSFVSINPVNEYAKKQRIDYDRIFKPDDTRIIFTRGFSDYEFCRCKDGVYVSDEGRLMEFYVRDDAGVKCDYCRSLVYCPDNTLRSSFGGEIIAD